MIGHAETESLCDDALTLLDGLIDELRDGATSDAKQMIVMGAFIQFEDRLGAFEIQPIDQPCRLELRQHPIYSPNTNLFPGIQQCLVHILCAHVTLGVLLQDLQYSHAWYRSLESGLFQIIEFQCSFAS